MKIVRDGKEYELTESELIQAWNEYEDICVGYDVKDQFEYYRRDCEAFDKWCAENKEKLQEIVDEAVSECMFKREYYGSYCAEDVVREVIEDNDLSEVFDL